MWKFKHLIQANKAWGWYKSLPDWLRLAPKWDERKEFVKYLAEGWKYGAFEGNELKAVVQANNVVNSTAEGHLYCDRKTDPDLVVGLLVFAKHDLFTNRGINQVISCVHKKHKGLARIVQTAGFHDTGFRLWTGLDMNGNLFETNMYIALR